MCLTPLLFAAEPALFLADSVYGAQSSKSFVEKGSLPAVQGAIVIERESQKKNSSSVINLSNGKNPIPVHAEKAFQIISLKQKEKATVEIKGQTSETGFIAVHFIGEPLQTTNEIKDGTLKLSNLVTLRIPKESFEKKQAVTIKLEPAPDIFAEYHATAVLTSDLGPVFPHAFSISSKTPPKSPMTVEIQLPPQFTKGLFPHFSPIVMAQIFEDGGQEILDSFEKVKARDVGPSLGQISFDIEPTVFTNRRSTADVYEARIVIASKRRK